MAGPFSTCPSIGSKREPCTGIPTVLGRVPRDDTPEVRADSRVLMHRAFRIAISGNVLDAAPHDRALARPHFAQRADIARASPNRRTEPRHSGSRARTRRRRARSCATDRRASPSGFSRPRIRSVSSIPAIVPWVMPVARIAGGDVDVSRRPGLRPMNAMPSIGSITCPDQRKRRRRPIGKCCARPRLQPREPLVAVVRLARLVVLAADDQVSRGVRRVGRCSRT